MDKWLASVIVVSDPDGLRKAIHSHRDDRNTWSYYSDCLYGNGDDFGDIGALSDFAPFIASGFVQGVDDDRKPFRFVFRDGRVIKQIPQWIDA